jgi:hypothetical protein
MGYAGVVERRPPMTKKKAQLKKMAFKEGVRAGAVLARRVTLEADYKALIRQWFWLEEQEQWRAEVYAEVLKKRGEAKLVKKFEELYI